MNSVAEKIITGPVMDLLQKIAGFLPDILTAAAILIVGLLAGWLIRVIIVKTLRVLKVDALMERHGLARAVEKGGIKESPGSIIGRMFQWLTVITFAIMALDSVRIPAVESLIERFFLYLPNVLVAALVVVAGFMIANFLERAALIASVNAGIKFSSLIGKSVKTFTFIFTLTMALEQLGIGSNTVIIAFAVVFSGAVFAISLSFGLAGKDLAREYLEKRLKGQKEKPDDLTHI